MVRSWCGRVPCLCRAVRARSLNQASAAGFMHRIDRSDFNRSSVHRHRTSVIAAGYRSHLDLRLSALGVLVG